MSETVIKATLSMCVGESWSGDHLDDFSGGKNSQNFKMMYLLYLLKLLKSNLLFTIYIKIFIIKILILMAMVNNKLD